MNDYGSNFGHCQQRVLVLCWGVIGVDVPNMVLTVGGLLDSHTSRRKADRDASHIDTEQTTQCSYTSQ